MYILESGSEVVILGGSSQVHAASGHGTSIHLFTSHRLCPICGENASWVSIDRVWEFERSCCRFNEQLQIVCLFVQEESKDEPDVKEYSTKLLLHN